MNPERSNNPPTELAAYNEAGHAVCCYVLGRAFAFELVSTADGQRFAQTASDRAPLLDLRPKVIGEILIALAGPAAVSKQAGDDYRNQDDEDVQADRARAQQLAALLDEAQANPDAFLALVSDRAEALISEAWVAVEQLARALITSGQLWNYDATRIIEAALAESKLSQRRPHGDYLDTVARYRLPDKARDRQPLFDFDDLREAMRKGEPPIDFDGLREAMREGEPLIDLGGLNEAPKKGEPLK